MGTTLKRRTIDNRNSTSRIIEKRAYNHYITLMKNWDREKLDSKPALKALLLDKQGKFIELIDLPEAFEVNTAELLNVALTASAYSIVLGQNDFDDNMRLENSEKNLIAQLKRASRNSIIKLTDYIKFSKWGYFSLLWRITGFN